MAEKDEKDSMERLSLADASGHLLDECRMVLPGVQALFGFQLIVVFNNGFASKLSTGQQQLHLLALGLVATAAAIIMTPAAFHRQVHPHHSTEQFIKLSTRLLMWGMIALAIGVCIDFYLIARVILGTSGVWWTGLLVCIYVGLWLVLPRVAGKKK